MGTFSIDLATVGGELPTGSQFQLQGELTPTLPLCATLPKDASILISSTGKLRDQGIALIQNSMLRVLTSIPPGKAKFILIDPVGLGQSFAGVLHLADYEESQLLDRAWTEALQVQTLAIRFVRPCASPVETAAAQTSSAAVADQHALLRHRSDLHRDDEGGEHVVRAQTRACIGCYHGNVLCNDGAATGRARAD